MTPARWASVVLAALMVLVTTSLTSAPILARAQPASHAQPAHTQPAHTQPAADDDSDGQFVSIDITGITPSTVTTSSSPTVTVSGALHNVGDRTVDDVSVRMQRAAPVATPDQLRTVLTEDQNAYDTVGDFQTVSESLDVGASADFSVTMPLRSALGPSLNITAPGVFPLLINVNGVPEYGQQARLDDKRFLLPVVGVPRDPTVVDQTAPEGVPLPPDTANPVAVSVMWPLADRPRLAGGQAGTVDDKIRLTDDDLATSLSPGGRLDGLVSAMEFATGGSVDPGGALANSVCLAVDPDLLVTVVNMTRGYLVVDNVTDPMGPAHDGTGAAAATQWLDRVRALAARLCVTSVPFAQVDLAAVAEIGNASLTSSALTAPADVVDTVLGVTSVRGFVWPDSGVMNDQTAEAVRGGGDATALLASNAVAGDQRQDLVRTAGPSTTGNTLDVALFDPETATALAAMGDGPQTPSFTPREQVFDVARDSAVAREQDALGALNYLAVTPTPGRERTLTVVPPQSWSADADEAAAVLSSVSAQLRSGLATPRPLSVLISRTPAPAATSLIAPPSADADGTPADIRDAASAQATRVDQLMTALVEDPQNPLTPRRYTNPIREDLLRAMSTFGRRGAGRDAADTSSHQRIDAIRRGLDTTLGSVTVLAPGGVFTLASEQSPLLLVARNDLPIGITVRLSVDAPEQMQIEDIGPELLPPRGSRSLQVPAKVSDSAKLVVRFGLTTSDGLQLGEATTVTVRSNAYGQALAIITASAAVLLLLLAGRRLWHRFRGQPDPADEG